VLGKRGWEGPAVVVCTACIQKKGKLLSKRKVASFEQAGLKARCAIAHAYTKRTKLRR